MKKLILFGLLMFGVQTLFAQNYNNVRRIEFELGLGGTKSNTTANGISADTGIQCYLDMRINFPGTPFDISFKNTIGGFRINVYDYTNLNIGYYTMIFGGDYNLRKWRRAAPFIGFGVGFATVNSYYRDITNEPIDRQQERNNSFAFNPRIGVELFSHLRITLEYKWMHTPYSRAYFGLNIGGVFGGGPKK